MAYEVKSSRDESCLQEKLEQLNKINYDGNIIPFQWFKHITNEKGKPNLPAIMILSEIIYWYRPTIVRDERSGEVTGLKKKFKADLLQKNYEDLANQFGLSKRQATEAVKKLEDHGLIKRILRNVKGISNILYIDIFPDKVEEITKRNNTPPTEKCDISHKKMWDLPQKNVIPPTKKCETYTEITTETTTNISLTNEREKLNIFDKLINIWENRVGSKIKNKNLPEKTKIKIIKAFKEFFNEDFNKWDSYCKEITCSKFLMGEVNNFKLGFLDSFKENYISKIFIGEFNIGDRDPNLTSDEKEKLEKNDITVKIQSNIHDIDQYLLELKEKEKLNSESWTIIKSSQYYIDDNNKKINIKSFTLKKYIFDSLKERMLEIFKKYIPILETIEIV